MPIPLAEEVAVAAFSTVSGPAAVVEGLVSDTDGAEALSIVQSLMIRRWLLRVAFGGCQRLEFEIPDHRSRSNQ